MELKTMLQSMGPLLAPPSGAEASLRRQFRSGIAWSRHLGSDDMPATVRHSVHWDQPDSTEHDAATLKAWGLLTNDSHFQCSYMMTRW